MLPESAAPGLPLKKPSPFSAADKSAGADVRPQSLAFAAVLAHAPSGYHHGHQVPSGGASSASAAGRRFDGGILSPISPEEVSSLPAGAGPHFHWQSQRSHRPSLPSPPPHHSYRPHSDQHQQRPQQLYRGSIAGGSDHYQHHKSPRLAAPSIPSASSRGVTGPEPGK